VPQEPVLRGAQVTSGLSGKWTWLSPGLRMLGRTYYLMLTEQHLLFCWISAWTGRPREVTMTVPREQVRVEALRLHGQMGWLRCRVPDRQAPMTLRFLHFWRPEVQAMLAELGTGGADTGGSGSL
jgi:hypothetical protein